MSQTTAVQRKALRESASTLPSQYLTFVLAGEAYAIGILAIKEIIEHGNMTRVPMMPEFIRGVINLRGAVVPVIDLGVRFGTGATQVTRRTCIVIVEVENPERCASRSQVESQAESQVQSQVVGILVDAVNEVMDIAGASIEPAPDFGTRISTEFIAGMARIADKFVIILDPARVLSVDQMAVLVQSGAPGEAADAANDAADAVAPQPIAA